jgi:hypothetical protein
VIVTLNAKLLKGNISFFQSICVLGYCLFPINISALLVSVGMPFLAKFLLVMAGFAWASMSSVAFVGSII